MTRPTREDVHIDSYMSNISIAYRNDSYIADKILPRIKVEHKSDKYAKYTKAAWFRNEAQVRAPGNKPPEADYALDTAGTYDCLPWSMAKRVPYEVRDNADDPIRPEQEAVEWCTDKIMLAAEIRAAAQLFDAATNFVSYTATAAALTGGGQVAWSTFATSTPRKDIEQMRDNVRSQIGRYPNTMVMGAAVWKALKQHPDYQDAIKYTQLGILTESLFSSISEIPRIFIGTGIYSNTAEDVTFSSTNIWGTSVLVGWVPERPSLLVPALGYTLVWKERLVERTELADLAKATLFNVEEHVDEIVTAADAGYLLTSVVS